MFEQGSLPADMVPGALTSPIPRSYPESRYLSRTPTDGICPNGGGTRTFPERPAVPGFLEGVMR